MKDKMGKMGMGYGMKHGDKMVKGSPKPCPHCDGKGKKTAKA